MANPTSDLENVLDAALSDRFTLQEEVGRGGMAVVYAAWDERHHRRVAVKVLHAQIESPESAQRFLAEIRTTAALSHPNLVPFIDSGQAGEHLYYIMPLLKGESLDSRIRREGNLPVRDSLRIAGDVAAGLAYAHRHGVIHRDVKPGNILLTPDGHATLSDFGVAHAVYRASTEPLTRPGFVVGTPGYMSPEQAAGQPIDARADVYALGLVLHEMLSGTPPTRGSRPAPLNSLRADVSRELSAVVSRALAPKPEDRFGTVDELAEDLERVAREHRPAPGLTPRGPSYPGHDDRRQGGQRSQLLAMGKTKHRKPVLLAAILTAVVALTLPFVLAQDGDDPSAGADTAVAADPLPEVRVGVLPVEIGPGADDAADWARLIQHYLAAELSRHRGVAVVDPLSLNSRLAAEAAEGTGDFLEELRGWDVHFAVRSRLVGNPGGFYVSYVLTDTRREEVVETGSFGMAGDAELPARLARVSARLLQSLDRETGGITRTLDIEPWLSHSPSRLAAVEAFLRGTDYSYRGMPGGREHFEKAVALDSTFIAPRVWLVSGLTAAGDTAEAERHIEALQALKPDATPFEQAAVGWAEATVRGDEEARIHHLRVALGYSPRNNVLLYELGETLYEMGRVAEALEPVRRAAASHWAFPPLYPLLGVLAVQLGELDGLRNDLEAARELVGPSPRLDGVLEALALFEGDAEAASRYRRSLRSQMAAGPAQKRLTELVPVYRSLARRARSAGDSATAAVLQGRAAAVEGERATIHGELPDRGGRSARGTVTVRWGTAAVERPRSVPGKEENR